MQRGSVQFNTLCAGDPARAYLGPSGTRDVCGYDRTDLIPSIPVLPISYGDAEPILAGLGPSTPLAPPGFKGGLDLAYRLGPTRLAARMDVRNREAPSTPIWNVVTRVRGAQHGSAADRPVLLGNHRDAWVFGAVDPNSGTATMLELGRGLGKLVGSGWVPRRSVYLLSWSGEEFGLLGSTAWGEIEGSWLAKQAVAYVNVDSGVSGANLGVSATPALGAAIRAAAADVADPSGGSVASRWSGRVDTLGSGSDYTVFLDHLGIASADLAFSGDYGVYHSAYDSFDWMLTQGDPLFLYHVAMARLWGLLALRLADAVVLPFDHTDQAAALRSYQSDLQRIADASGHTFDFTALTAAVDAYVDAAHAVGACARRAATERRADAELNERLAMTERRFLTRDGLPRRPWFKHVLQAPGFYLGYAPDSLPGAAQAVRDGDWALAQAQIGVAAEAIAAAAEFLGGGGAEQAKPKAARRE